MSRKVQLVVFLALVLDLLAFTIPLPLFPRIIEWYTSRETGDPTGFLSRTLAAVRTIRSTFLTVDVGDASRKRWDVVLLGGLMGSLFSTLQFIISPFLGSLSDRFGRKRVLLLSMIGNLLSAVVWLQSTSFSSFMLARAIGGISEGNVQLSIAILSDVTTPATRGKALSLVGIAFGLCFCIGPPLGAYFASRPVSPSSYNSIIDFNIYAAPAALTLVLLLVETVFLMAFLPETKGKGALPDLDDLDVQSGKVGEGEEARREKASPVERLRVLATLKRYHFAFLAIFSGVEFTLTFLSFDLFDWNNSQNGRLLGFIGVLSTLLQGGYVRRAMAKTGELTMARRGVSSSAISLLFLTSLPFVAHDQSSSSGSKFMWGIRLLYAAAAFLAFTSATVVNSLTALASLQCDDDDDNSDGDGDRDGDGDGKENVKDGEKRKEMIPQLAKGRALGGFRSSGQLGRAIGPLLACASYWTAGPSITYGVSAVIMFALASRMRMAAKPKTKTS